MMIISSLFRYSHFIKTQISHLVSTDNEYKVARLPPEYFLHYIGTRLGAIEEEVCFFVLNRGPQTTV
jgi:hypothetical protein